MAKDERGREEKVIHFSNYFSSEGHILLLLTVHGQELVALASPRCMENQEMQSLAGQPLLSSSLDHGMKKRPVWWTASFLIRGEQLVALTC